MALLPLQREGITLGEKQRVTKMLLERGASIDEMNAMRKHISRVKGGQLARVADPATSISLLLSDVVGDRMEVIASGPTVLDESIHLQRLHAYPCEIPPGTPRVGNESD